MGRSTVLALVPPRRAWTSDAGRTRPASHATTPRQPRGAFRRYRIAGVAGDDERYAAFLDALRARFAEDAFVFVVPDERARDDERHEDLVAAVLGEYDRTLRIAVARDDARALVRTTRIGDRLLRGPGRHVRCALSPRDASFPNPRPAAREPAPVVVVGGGVMPCRLGTTRRTSVDDHLVDEVYAACVSRVRLRLPTTGVIRCVDMDVPETTRAGRWLVARGDTDRRRFRRQRIRRRLRADRGEDAGPASRPVLAARARRRGRPGRAPRRRMGCVVSLEARRPSKFEGSGRYTARPERPRGRAIVRLAPTSVSAEGSAARLKYRARRTRSYAEVGVGRDLVG